MNLKNILIVICLLLGMAEMVFGQSTYSELTLKDAIEIALKNNPSVISAKEKVNIASSRMGQAGSNLFPKISLDFSRGKSYIQSPSIVLPPTLGGGTFSVSPNEASNITSYSLTLRQTLFTGGKVLTGMMIAKIGYEIAREDFRKAKMDTEFNVISQYFDILKAQKSLDVVNESANNLNKMLEQTEIMFNAGISSNSDILRVKTQIANMRIFKIQTESGLNMAKLIFKSTLSKKIPDDIKLKDEKITDAAAVEINQDELLKKALENRPDIKIFHMGLKVAKDSIGMAYGGFLPNVAYMYSTGKNKSSYPLANTTYDLDNWRSVVVASWSIFDGFDTVNKIREAYAALNAAAAQEQMIKDGIALEVNMAYLSLKSLVEKIDAGRIAADLAELAFKSSEVNYKAGIISNQAYLDAQTALHSTEINLLSSKYDFEIAKAKLNKVVGLNIL